MSESERITVSLPRDVMERLRHAVAAGEFATVSDAVEAAVMLWETEQRMPDIDADTLKRMVEEGIASGEPVEMSIDDIKARARVRLAEVRKAS